MRFKLAEKNLLILTFAAFVQMLGVSIISLILVLYAINLGADAFLSGVAVGAFSISQIIFQIPIGKLSDRIGRKNTLLLALCVYAVGTFLCGWAQDIYQLIIFRLIQGTAAYMSVIHAFIGDLYPSEKRGRAMSFYTSGTTLGYAVGMPLGGFFASLFLNLPFFLHFGFIITNIVLIYYFLDEQQMYKNNAPNSSKKNSHSNYWEEIFKNRLLLLTILTDCLSVFVFSSLLAFIAKFAQSFGIGTFHFSLIMIPLVLIMTLGFFIGGKLGDRIGRSKTILLGFTIAGPFLLIQSLVNAPLELILIASTIVFGIGVAWPTIPALILDSISESCRVTGTSVYNTFRYVAMALGPIVMGYLIGIFSPNPADLSPGIRISYLISGIIYMLACLLVFFFLRKCEKEKFCK